MLYPLPPTSTVSTRPRSGSERPSGLPPWGWLEGYLIAQTFIPALLFVPGLSAIRTAIRVASFLLAIVAWIMIYQGKRVRPGAQTFPSTFWLKIAMGWLLLSVFYWKTNSLESGLAQAMVYISVFSPAFWAPAALVSSRQVGRLMAILALCNGLSAAVGLGQVFRPQTFNPPVVAGLQNRSAGILMEDVVKYEDGFGNKILRPCGLTDQAGAASGAGGIAALIGLALFLRPIGIVRRLFCLGMAFIGVAVIYYTQVRMVMLMLVISVIVLTAILIVRKDFKRATLLGSMSLALVVGAFVWVSATSGASVTSRFSDLLVGNFAKKYDESRGGFVREAFTVMLWDYPFGAGLGWWGQIYNAFGDKTIPSKIWVEVMWPAWVIDGGFPLLLTYVAAIGFAMADTLRVALRSRDRDLSFWASVVFASNLSLLATCFSYVTFLTSLGIQFWLLAATVHAADLRAREREHGLRASGPDRALSPTPV